MKLATMIFNKLKGPSTIGKLQVGVKTKVKGCIFN